MDKVIISCKNNDFLVYPKLFIVFFNIHIKWVSHMPRHQRHATSGCLQGRKVPVQADGARWPVHPIGMAMRFWTSFQSLSPAGFARWSLVPRVLPRAVELRRRGQTKSFLCTGMEASAQTGRAQCVRRIHHQDGKVIRYTRFIWVDVQHVFKSITPLPPTFLYVFLTQKEREPC